MKSFLLIFAVVLLSISALKSQGNSGPQSAQEILTQLKASNAELIEKQKKTLETLDQMLQEATTIKIWSKRS